MQTSHEPAAAVPAGPEAGIGALSPAEARFERARQTIGLFVGPAAFVLVLATPLPGLGPEAHRLAAVVTLVVCWWISEAIPIPATALLGTELANALRQQTGHSVMLQTDTSPNITKRLAAGERPDVLIALAATVDQAITEGKAIAATRASIGRIGVGVAISRGGRRPDITTVDALRTSLLQADAILYSGGRPASMSSRCCRPSASSIGSRAK